VRRRPCFGAVPSLRDYWRWRYRFLTNLITALPIKGQL
jgi:hypothetical protein